MEADLSADLQKLNSRQIAMAEQFFSAKTSKSDAEVITSTTPAIHRSTSVSIRAQVHPSVVPVFRPADGDGSDSFPRHISMYLSIGDVNPATQTVVADLPGIIARECFSVAGTQPDAATRIGQAQHELRNSKRPMVEAHNPTDKDRDLFECGHMSGGFANAETVQEAAPVRPGGSAQQAIAGRDGGGGRGGQDKGRAAACSFAARATGAKRKIAAPRNPLVPGAPTSGPKKAKVNPCLLPKASELGGVKHAQPRLVAIPASSNHLSARNPAGPSLPTFPSGSIGPANLLGSADHPLPSALSGSISARKLLNGREAARIVLAGSDNEHVEDRDGWRRPGRPSSAKADIMGMPGVPPVPAGASAEKSDGWKATTIFRGQLTMRDKRKIEAAGGDGVACKVPRISKGKKVCGTREYCFPMQHITLKGSIEFALET